MQVFLSIFLIVACGNLAFVAAQKCQECQTSNEAYCLNQTSYQNCMKNNPIGDVQHCPEGTVCTNDSEVCAKNPDGTDIIDVCGSDSTCESCTGTSTYTCVSRTQYARCKDRNLITSDIYNCENDKVCYQKGYKDHQTICVPKSALDYLNEKPSCTNDDFTTTTTTAAPPTTPSLEDKQKICEAAASGTSSTSNEGSSPESTSTTAKPVTKSFSTRNTGDETCSTYLYCQKRPNETKWTAKYYTCSPKGTYFDSTTKTCVATKPTDCS